MIPRDLIPSGCDLTPTGFSLRGLRLGDPVWVCHDPRSSPAHPDEDWEEITWTRVLFSGLHGYGSDLIRVESWSGGFLVSPELVRLSAGALSLPGIGLVGPPDLSLTPADADHFLFSPDEWEDLVMACRDEKPWRSLVRWGAEPRLRVWGQYGPVRGPDGTPLRCWVSGDYEDAGSILALMS